MGSCGQQYYYYFDEPFTTVIQENAFVDGGTYKLECRVENAPDLFDPSPLISAFNFDFTVTEQAVNGGFEGLSDTEVQADLTNSAITSLDGSGLYWDQGAKKWKDHNYFRIDTVNKQVKFRSQGLPGNATSVSIHNDLGKVEQLEGLAHSHFVSAVFYAVQTTNAAIASQNSMQLRHDYIQFPNGTQQSSAADETPAYYHQWIYRQGDSGTDPNTPETFYNTIGNENNASKDMGQSTFYSRGSIQAKTQHMQSSDSTVTLYTMWVFNTTDSNIEKY